MMLKLGGLGFALLALSLASLNSGVIDLSSLSAEQADMIFWEIRLPRLLLALMVGAALGIAGAALQGLFRNPLADPGLIGVASGSALFAVASIVLGLTFVLPLAAFLGGLLITAMIYQIATRQGHTDVGLMLLAGIAINAVIAAMTGVLTFVADDPELRGLVFWTMGSVAGADHTDWLWVAAPLLVALLGLMALSRSLNAYLLGENIAHHMGYSVKHLKIGVMILSALAVSSSVSMAGPLVFVGLMAPHWVRMLMGADHRWLLPGSALMGALLVVASDWCARGLVAPNELPLGLVIAFIGGPFFLWLLLQKRMKLGV